MQMDTLLLFHFSLSDPIPHCPLQTFRIVLNGIAYFSMAVSSGIVMSREAMRTERHFKLKILFRMIHKLDLASASPGEFVTVDIVEPTLRVSASAGGWCDLTIWMSNKVPGKTDAARSVFETDQSSAL